MQAFLRAIAHHSYSKPWLALSSWLVILSILGFGAYTYMQPLNPAISIPGTEAQKSLDDIARYFPDSSKGSGRIVFAATDEQGTVSGLSDRINAILAEVAAVEGVANVVSPAQNPTAVSQDQKVSYAIIQFDSSIGNTDKETVDAIAAITSTKDGDGLQIERGGDLINRTPDEILGIGEAAGVVLALVVLVMTLGSLIAAGMPILIALLAIGVSMAGLFSLSELITVSSTTPVLAVMLGLAVGIDYSLFILSKYRSYLLEGYQEQAAVHKSLQTAGSAVIFAALTVVIALSALTVVNIPFMTTMGLAGAATVAVAALVAITTLPALMRLAGTNIFMGKTRAKIVAAQKAGVHHTEHVKHEGFWYKLGNNITKRPIYYVIGTIGIVAVLAIPAFSLKLGLPSDEFAADGETSKAAYQLIEKNFGAGANGPLLMLVEGLPETTAQDVNQTKQLLIQQYISTLPPEQQQFASQGLPAEATAQFDAQAAQFAPFLQYKTIADEIATLDGVASAQPVQTAENGSVGLIQVTPKTGPSNDATKSLIAQLRDTSYQSSLAQSATIGVTGATAVQVDINKKLSDALPLYLGVVVGLSLLLLLVVFRSVIVPIKATLGFLLSVAAMFGAMVAIAQWGWFGWIDAPGPLVSFIPIIAIGILFGLAMDYQFFMVSNIHEAHMHTKDAKKAVRRGFVNGGRVVVAAASIMVAIFAGFITNHDTTIQTIGLGLAVGVFVDAFLVRLLLIPALLSMIGNAAWWLPRALEKRLPKVSIEGGE